MPVQVWGTSGADWAGPALLPADIFKNRPDCLDQPLVMGIVVKTQRLVTRKIKFLSVLDIYWSGKGATIIFSRCLQSVISIRRWSFVGKFTFI